MEFKALYLDGMNVEVEINKNKFIIDASREKGNAPMDHIISALAACTLISISSILKRMHEDFEHLEVQVNGEQFPDPPKIFKKIELNYYIKGKLKRENFEKAIELTFEKYSPSAVILKRAGVELKYSFIINQ